MKMRHVRAVAVAAVVVVALTGARRGGDGGGCDDNSSSSSSSSGGYSSGGSSDYDDDDDYQSSTGDYGSTPSAGPTTAAESDIRITDCVINGVSSTQAKITWKYTITNGDASGSADYSGTMIFNDSSGSRVGSTFFSHDAVAVGTPYEGTVEDAVYDSDVAQLQGRCEVSSVIKSPSL
ncbi:hypothetical protein RCO28_19140 [Streptomyces sp. LHD-70]|uniref:hypothetical protein n=1 Tax=Streptomyces sp. LHD-70 TaxID=3072140 RepID=UPI00280D67D3|nr:hypothetical protein [Streptomyces sp. LHD-70]MDQ8704589.1 hypothetical protein [Streptomyces sp. LHD-70]